MMDAVYMFMEMVSYHYKGCRNRQSEFATSFIILFRNLLGKVLGSLVSTRQTLLGHLKGVTKATWKFLLDRNDDHSGSGTLHKALPGDTPVRSAVDSRASFFKIFYSLLILLDPAREMELQISVPKAYKNWMDIFQTLHLFAHDLSEEAARHGSQNINMIPSTVATGRADNGIELHMVAS